tara:strand:+ start:85 stop:801 length:717 start_codon:yes stop_codon:yes gene_type:complete
MTRLSVNINKVATIRNARGGNMPDLVQVAKDIEAFGANGITVHPRPDERHIRYDDVWELRAVVKTELNVEGNPKEDRFVDLVSEVLPDQVTLVPDSQNQLTSNHGWDTVKNQGYLTEIIAKFRNLGIRTSIFVDADLDMIEGAATTGTDRIELYTEEYASGFEKNRLAAIEPYVAASKKAMELKLGLNAGHDLNRTNLRFFAENIVGLSEVSIGHAFVSDALYYGFENTVGLYLRELR